MDINIFTPCFESKTNVCSVSHCLFFIKSIFEIILIFV